MSVSKTMDALPNTAARLEYAAGLAVEVQRMARRSGDAELIAAALAVVDAVENVAGDF